MRDILYLPNIVEYYRTADILRKRFPQVRITDISLSFNSPTFEILIQKQESNPHIPSHYFQFLFDNNLEEFSAYVRLLDVRKKADPYQPEEYDEVVEQLYKGKVARTKLQNQSQAMPVNPLRSSAITAVSNAATTVKSLWGRVKNKLKGRDDNGQQNGKNK